MLVGRLGVPLRLNPMTLAHAVLRDLAHADFVLHVRLCDINIILNYCVYTLYLYVYICIYIYIDIYTYILFILIILFILLLLLSYHRIL